MRPRIAVTLGEPAGIGPDICLELLRRGGLPDCEVVLVGCPETLKQRAQVLGCGDVALPKFEHSQSPELSIWPVHTAAPVTAGHLDTHNAAYVLETLKVAAENALNGTFAAICTAPVHKGIINDAGVPFSGHTEYFAERAEAYPVMMLASGELRVALVTTHLPLSQVPSVITAETLERVVRILHRDLQQKFAIEAPRISVCGLNPHAGEGGHLGDEEIRVISPVLEQLRDEGIDLTGPLPADTAFTHRHLNAADAVLAMYHDQGLPVLKHASFGEAINITLGLPFIRTSVDHGTALDLAGSGQAEHGSLMAATQLARDLALKTL